MEKLNHHLRMLKTAELQFRFAYSAFAASASGLQLLHLPSIWTYGKHTVYKKEIDLTLHEMHYASQHLYDCATYLMAVQIRQAFKELVPNARGHTNSDVRSAYQISRLIRNSFTHNPFHPVWYIDDDCKNQIFIVSNIVDLDTTELNGKPFSWQDYGGLLAILKLSEFVRVNILRDKNSSDTNPVFPDQSKDYESMKDFLNENVFKDR
jgi:hypothetical protein